MKKAIKISLIIILIIGIPLSLALFFDLDDSGIFVICVIMFGLIIGFTPGKVTRYPFESDGLFGGRYLELDDRDFE